MTQLECVKHLGLGQFLGGTLHHANAIVVASDHKVQTAILATTGVVRENAELTINVSHAGCRHGGFEGQSAHANRGE